MFVGFPSQKGNDDEYHDTVWVEKEVREQVIELAKREYESSTEQEQELPVMPTAINIGDGTVEDLPF